MKNIIMILLPLALIACSSTSSTIAPNADFSRYTYAAIGSDIDGGAVIYEAQMQIQNSLISTGYQVIGDTKLRVLSLEEQGNTIIVTMGLTSTSEKTVCIINVTDYMSGYILGTFKGIYGLGWDIEDDQKHAITMALGEIESVLQM